MSESKFASDRLPGLDGLRAASIMLVVICHGSVLAGFPPYKWLTAFAAHGSFGVDVFFVLSGFLITWLLLKEDRETGGIDLRMFYARRGLRILPPAFFYLTFIAVLIALGISHEKYRDVAYAAFFVRNFLGHGPETGHFWSLAIEEQFYLVWPLLVFLLPRRWRLPVTVALIGIAPIWRRANYHLFPGNESRFPSRPDLRCDSLLMGCLLAMLRSDPTRTAILRRRAFQSTVTFAACIGVITILLSPIGKAAGARIGTIFPSIEYACVALMINYVIEGRATVPNRILNLVPMIWVGQLSFSLYLWQQIFCWRESSLSVAFVPAVALTVVGAVVSFYFVEKPMLRIRRKLGSKAPRPVIGLNDELGAVATRPALSTAEAIS